MTKNVVVIAHNIRSTHNIGSILRTCDGFGVEKVFICGYSPYPKIANDQRLPHIAEKLDKQIHKSALGAEKLVNIRYAEDPYTLIDQLKSDGYTILALEQHKNSVNLSQYSSPNKVAVLLGEEVAGIDKQLLNKCDDIVEIAMFGQKESFNVSVAAGIILYELSKSR